MIACLRAGIPSAGAYLISPVFKCATVDNIASIGTLLFGSPPPRWIAGSPFSFSIANFSLRAKVGEGFIDFAIRLKLILFPVVRRNQKNVLVKRACKITYTQEN